MYSSLVRTRSTCACHKAMGTRANTPRIRASRHRPRARASITQAAKSAMPAVRRRNPAAASTKAAVSCSHGRDGGKPLGVTSTKRTLTRANGTSANKRSDRKMVMIWSKQSVAATSASLGRRYFLAKASTAKAKAMNKATYERRSHGPTTAGFVVPRAR